MQLPNNLVCFRCAAHWIVQDIGRSDLVSLEDPLHLHLGFDRRHAHRPTRPMSRPVEFGFGIDHHDDHRQLLGRPVDCPPCARVKHASPECSTAACLPTSLGVTIRSYDSEKPSSRHKPFLELVTRYVTSHIAPQLS